MCSQWIEELIADIFFNWNPCNILDNPVEKIIPQVTVQVFPSFKQLGIDNLEQNAVPVCFIDIQVFSYLHGKVI